MSDNKDVQNTHFADQPVSVDIHDGRVWVSLADGRIIAAPVAWYPFLMLATPEQLRRIELQAFVVVWPELDDGISIESLLAGRKPPHTIEQYIEAMKALREDKEETAAD